MLPQSAAPCSGMMHHMTSKSRITVNLSEAEHSALDQLAGRLKVSKAWLGRHAIAQLLERAQEDETQLLLPLTGPKQRGSR